ncbi:MAG TPA: flagellar biosynthetic protein FliO [Acidimicrobiales bacterium]|nr:flagellar biosynthetic protein FliO [Acidimicrobiales bacterium]
MPQLSRALALAHYAAAHRAAGPGSTGAQSVSASSLLIQMVVALIVIVVLIKLASKFVQGRGGRALGHGPRPQGVAVVGRQSLGKGVQVAMVAAGRQTYLLGVTQRQVTLLGQVDTEALVPAEGDDGDPGGLHLLRGGNRPAAITDGSVPGWKSAIEQMRLRTVRRA